jgi:hypothetical protein
MKFLNIQNYIQINVEHIEPMLDTIIISNTYLRQWWSSWGQKCFSKMWWWTSNWKQWCFQQLKGKGYGCNSINLNITHHGFLRRGPSSKTLNKTPHEGLIIIPWYPFQYPPTKINVSATSTIIHPLTKNVATLALGSRPRQGLARTRAKREARECGRVWEWTLTLPNELPLELESRWTPKTSENDCKGQNPSPWRVIDIIENLLKRRCPKWACMTHLDIYNPSYDQKKGRESNLQFDSQPREVRNRPDALVCRWHATRRWKALDEGYNFGLNLISIGGLHKKL